MVKEFDRSKIKSPVDKMIVLVSPVQNFLFQKKPTIHPRRL